MDIDNTIKTWATDEATKCMNMGLSRKETIKGILSAMEQLTKIAKTAAVEAIYK